MPSADIQKNKQGANGRDPPTGHVCHLRVLAAANHKAPARSSERRTDNKSPMVIRHPAPVFCEWLFLCLVVA